MNRTTGARTSGLSRAGRNKYPSTNPALGSPKINPPIPAGFLWSGAAVQRRSSASSLLRGKKFLCIEFVVRAFNLKVRPKFNMHPYLKLEPKAFWRLAVAEPGFSKIVELWKPKFEISKTTPIFTAGSCFAQHFSKELQKRNFSWVNAEPAPFPLSNEMRAKYNYEIFSARTGNIYTARQFRQWMEWAINPQLAPKEVWEEEGRFYDPFRPSIEPKGFASEEELVLSRLTALRCFYQGVQKADVFVATLGLTEAWRNMKAGYEYTLCPGVGRGVFNENIHVFHNSTYTEIYSDMEVFIRLLREVKPDIKLLLTVSPVPLTATASQNHVLVASSYSKATLRSVVGELEASYDFCDYFPSYEIVTAPPFRGIFYSPNMRTVSSFGVNFVMNHFFTALGEQIDPPVATSFSSATLDPLCDEMTLDRG